MNSDFFILQTANGLTIDLLCFEIFTVDKCIRDKNVFHKNFLRKKTNDRLARSGLLEIEPHSLRSRDRKREIKREIKKC